MSGRKTWEEVTAELVAADEAVWPFTMPTQRRVTAAASPAVDSAPTVGEATAVPQANNASERGAQ